jgi:hypothetical protein
MQRIHPEQHTCQFRPVQELPQSRDLTSGVGGVGALSNRRAEAVGLPVTFGNVDAVGQRP